MWQICCHCLIWVNGLSVPALSKTLWFLMWKVRDIFSNHSLTHTHVRNCCYYIHHVARVYRYSSWKPKYVIENADEQAIFTIDGPCCPCQCICCPRDIEFPVSVALELVCQLCCHCEAGIAFGSVCMYVCVSVCVCARQNETDKMPNGNWCTCDCEYVLRWND